MKTKLFFSLAFATVVSFFVTSCGEVAPLSKDFLSDHQELSVQLDNLLKYAGTTQDKVEFIEFSFMHDAENPEDIKNSITISIVDPKNPDLIKEYMWYDMKDRRNSYTVNEVTMTDRFGSEVIEGHDKYKDLIFNYADVKEVLDNYDLLAKEALDAAGYGDKGYVKYFTRTMNRGYEITVGYDGKDVKKDFDISVDKKHIVKP